MDKSVEEKWQRKWEEAKVFEADPDEREKFFITFPYPYMNSAPHIGHAYTLSRVDVIARFRRMLGYNVLFPFAFHATGATIYGVAERLRKGDEDQKRALLVAGLPEEEIENFKDPVYIANYW
ncbi:leucine--tRNA ligase, partial [Thermococci archaeon]